MKRLLTAMLLTSGLLATGTAASQGFIPDPPPENAPPGYTPMGWAPSQEPPWTLWPPFHGFISWEGSFPVGGTRELNRYFTANALSAEGYFFLSPRWAIALGAAQYVYSERFIGTTTLGNGTLYGTHFFTTHLYPLSIGAQFTMLPKGPVSPYVGLRTGVLWGEQRVDLGFNTFVQSSWHWLVTADAGIVVPLNPVLLRAGLRYFVGIGNSQAPNQGGLGFHLGVGY